MSSLCQSPRVVLYVCYFLFKIVFDSVTFISREPTRGQNVLLYSTLFINLLFPINTSGDSASYVIEMVMLIFCR